MEVRKYTAKDMVEAWVNLEDVYELFREDNGLVDAGYNAFEICTALSDKHGRICREVKHAERNDHKPDWPDGLTSAMAGYVCYMIMLLKKYKCDLASGLEKELDSSLKQYGKNDENTN